MTTILDLGFDGSTFSVERELANIKKLDNVSNVFVSHSKNSKTVKTKFNLLKEPNQTFCYDSNKIEELKNKLIELGFTFHHIKQSDKPLLYLYVF